jgi:hypothetical protein
MPPPVPEQLSRAIEALYRGESGFAYVVFTAMVLDIVGRPEHAAASGYAVLNSTNGGFAIALFLITILAARHKPEGVDK